MIQISKTVTVSFDLSQLEVSLIHFGLTHAELRSTHMPAAYAVTQQWQQQQIGIRDKW